MFNLPLQPSKVSTVFANRSISFFQSSATWTCPIGTQKVEVWVLGGGGGGGGGGISGLINRSGGGGGGGGGGGISTCVFYGSSIPASACVCLGARGATGSAANIGVCAGNGGNGGVTSFGSLVHAGGGGGGVRGMSCCPSIVVQSAGGPGGTGNYLRGGTGGCSYFFASAGFENCAFPAIPFGGGGAGGGAGTCGGINYCGNPSAPSGASCLFPYSQTWGVGLDTGAAGGLGTRAGGGGQGSSATNVLVHEGGAGGGGGGAKACQAIGWSGGAGGSGRAVVVSYF